MTGNPYEPPKTPPGILERLTFSRWRIPLASVCVLIVPTFVATFVYWSNAFLHNDDRRRLSLAYVPMSILGILAFTMIAIGLFRQKPTVAKWGLGLFALVAVGQVLTSFYL